MTFFETAGQAAIFLMLLYAGAAAGITYDLLSPLRRHAPRPLAILLDGVWCALTGALCFFALALGGESTLRLYALLGLCCGAGIYSLGVRTAVRAVAGLFKKRKSPP